MKIHLYDQSVLHNNVNKLLLRLYRQDQLVRPPHTNQTSSPPPQTPLPPGRPPPPIPPPRPPSLLNQAQLHLDTNGVSRSSSSSSLDQLPRSPPIHHKSPPPLPPQPFRNNTPPPIPYRGNLPQSPYQQQFNRPRATSLTQQQIISFNVSSTRYPRYLITSNSIIRITTSTSASKSGTCQISKTSESYDSRIHST